MYPRGAAADEPLLSGVAAVSARFELSLCDGPLAGPHRRAVGDLERTLPWSTLDPSGLDPSVVARARGRWTELAFNEHRSIILMSQLVQALGEAQAPLDLHSMACAFPLEELVHAEVCARFASRLGGAADIAVASVATSQETDAGLTPAQRCHELVVRFCCVGETLSKRWLARMRERVTHPLVQAVLSRILRDEARHSSFGWLYLDWCLEEDLLDRAERERLAAAARGALEQYARAGETGEATVDEAPHDVLVTLRRDEMRLLVAQARSEIGAGFERRGFQMA
jgi:hypothetical protein